MKYYIFSTPSQKIDTERIRTCLQKIADTTNTSGLIVTLYLLPGAAQTRGAAYVQKNLTPRNFTTGRGKWAFTRKFPPPGDLPAHYKLIRLRIDSSSKRYPFRERDIYGWEFYYPCFYDHLATLFAHELHHFRRYHLDLHPREGEQSANKWAVQHVRALGYGIKARKVKKKKQKKSKYSTLLQKFPLLDPYLDFRQLKPADQVRITYDPSRKYGNQTATVKRSIRSNSKRLVITTRDGKNWRWPMEWIERITPDD